MVVTKVDSVTAQTCVGAWQARLISVTNCSDHAYHDDPGPTRPSLSILVPTRLCVPLLSTDGASLTIKPQTRFDVSDNHNFPYNFLI